MIGNIVSDLDINIGCEFNYSKNLNGLDLKLPTLIIGFDLSKELLGDIDVLNRSINCKLFWTFTKKEYRKIFNNDFDDFIQLCYINSINEIKYIYVDFIQMSPITLFKIYRKINSLNNLYSYEYDDRMLYIYSNNLIFGIDFELYNFVGGNVEKIKKKIKDKSLVFLSGNEVYIEYTNYMERLNYEAKYIPYLESLNKNE